MKRKIFALLILILLTATAYGAFSAPAAKTNLENNQLTQNDLTIKPDEGKITILQDTPYFWIFKNQNNIELYVRSFLEGEHNFIANLSIIYPYEKEIGNMTDSIYEDCSTTKNIIVEEINPGLYITEAVLEFDDGRIDKNKVWFFVLRSY